jgi:hypothetical protein
MRHTTPLSVGNNAALTVTTTQPKGPADGSRAYFD